MLRPVEDETIALPLCFEHSLLRRMARAFVDRDCEHGFARKDRRIPSVSVRRPRDRFRCNDSCCEERRRRQVAADLFKNERGFCRAKSEAALVFGNRDPGKPKLAELLP